MSYMLNSLEEASYMKRVPLACVQQHKVINIDKKIKCKYQEKKK